MKNRGKAEARHAWLTKILISALSLILLLVTTISSGEEDDPAPDSDDIRSKLTARLTSEELDWLSQDPVIRLGFDEGYAPYSFLEENGKLAGAAVEFADLLGEILGVRFEYVHGMEWSDLLDGAANRTIDAIATVVQTPEREAYLGFTQIYIPTPLVVMTATDGTSITDPADLKGHRVALVEGYATTGRVLKEHPGIEPLVVARPIEGLWAVADGSADAYVGVIGINVHLAAKHGISNLKVAAAYEKHGNGQRIAVRKDWPRLTSILSKALDVIPSEEKLALLHKWVPIQLPYATHQPIHLTESEKAWIASHPTLELAIDPEFAPIEYINDEGVYSGIAADYVKLLNERLGINMQVVSRTWTGAVEKIRKREVDILPAIGITEDRKSYLSYSRPYAEFHRVIITREDFPFIGSIDNITGYTVGVQDGSSHEGFVKEQTSIIPREYPTLREALLAVSNGDVDAFVGNVASSTYLIRKLNLANLKVAAPASQEVQTIHFGIRKDEPLLVSIINKGLASVSAEERTEIFNRWVSVRFEQKVDWTRAILISLGIALFLGSLLAVAMVWNRRLQRAYKELEKMDRLQELSDQLRKAKKEADKANRLKSEFLANMSHEIRTPLNIILGYIDLIVHSVAPEQGSKEQQYVEHINSAGLRLMDTIEKILDISRIHIEDFPFKPELVDLNELVKGSMNSMEILANLENVSMVTELEECPVYTKFDKYAASQALQNVIHNAIKYTKLGTITARITAHDDCFVSVEVIDTGIGVSEDYLPRIFDEFSQESVGYTRSYEGTGLGMALTRKFMEYGGGTVAIESQKHQGTRVTLRFPTATPDQVSATTTQPDSVLSATPALAEIGENKKTILIVEDDPATQQYLALALNEYYEVCFAASGVETDKILSTTAVDAILMDLSLNGEEDGTSIVKRLRSNVQYRYLPVIALTAHAHERDRNNALEAGCNLFLAKPVGLDRLLEAIESLFEGA